MSGVGSTNAMKKGSANNPFLAYSEADMQGFLNSAYTGCIVKYTGPSTKTAVPRGKKLSLGDAQNLVVDLTKNFTYSSVSYKSREWNIGIEIENSDNTKTNQCIMNIKIDSKTGIIGSGNNDIQALIYSEYTPYSSLYGKNINEISVKFLAVTSVNVNRDVVVNWPITYGKNGWQSDCFNDLGKITLWGYGETVLAYQNQNDMDYWGNGDVIYTEPYIVNELYKVVYSDGQYYFEEFYYISENVTTATVEDVAPGKTFYDFTGTKQTGTGTKINPYIASTADEMAAYLTSSYKGAFVKYIGETVTIGGTPIPVNPIAVGDTISKLYFDTTKEVDFSKFTYDQPAGDDIPTGVAILLSSQQNVNILTANDLSVVGMSGYVLMLTEEASQTSAAVRQTFLYASEVVPDLGVSQAGWQSGTSLDLLQGNTISIVNAQDIWGAYISKDGQWTSGVGESYVKNAIYQVAEDGDTTRYAILPTLSNPGTAADLVQGKQLIDGEGKVVEGEMEKVTNYLPSLVADELEEIPFDALKGCTKLSDYALYNKKNLKTINVPATIKTFGSRCTEGCSNLTKVNIESLRAWLESTFGEYGNLVTNESHLYVNNTLLTNLVKNDTDGITNISDYAFQYCTDLTTVELSDSVETIGRSVFSQCTNLTTFSAKSVTTIPERCFEGASLVSIDIPNVTIIMGAYSMGGGSRKSFIGKDLIFPKVTRVDQSAFYYCGAKSMSFPVLVKAIGSFTFYQNNYLEQIDLPNMEDMPSSYFLYNCTKIKSITLPKLKTFKLGGINYCNSLKTIDLPSVITISDYSSYCFSSMSNVRLLLRYNGVVSLSAKQLPNAITEVYVSSEQVDNYKTDAKWSVYANKIKSLDDFVE